MRITSQLRDLVSAFLIVICIPFQLVKVIDFVPKPKPTSAAGGYNVCWCFPRLLVSRFHIFFDWVRVMDVAEIPPGHEELVMEHDQNFIRKKLRFLLLYVLSKILHFCFFMPGEGLALFFV